MDYIVLSITSALNALLGLIVFTRNRKNKRNRYFLYFIVAVIFWSITNFVVDKTTTYDAALFWTKLTFVSSIYIPLYLFIFTNYYPIDKKIKIIWPHFILAATLTLLVSFGYVVKGVQDINVHPIVPVFGTLYYVFVAYFMIYIFIALKHIFSSLKNSSGLKKLQIRYLFFGILLSTIFAATTNLILPLFGFSDLSNYGVYGLIIFIAITFYTITKHSLFEIRLIITRSLIYGVLLALVTSSFVLVTLISGQYFQGNVESKILIGVLVSMLIVFGLDPLKRLLSRATDKFFFKAKIDYQLILRKLSETLSFELDQTKLITDLRQTLTQELKIKFAATLLRRNSNGGTEKFEALSELLAQNPNLSIHNDSKLITYLRDHRHPAIYESLERKIDDTREESRGPLIASKEEFERMGAALISPIYAQDHLIALLVLGQKLSGDTFSNEDVQLIEVLSPQIGSAIQKANLFEEVRQFGASLEVKVKEATETLEERNTSLQTLQNITREITRTLDFNRVAQNIANSIATELGYLGAILVLLDDDGHTARARAVTETGLTKKAIKLLPRHYSDYPSDLDDPHYQNFEAKVLRTGKVHLTDHISDIVSPPLPLIVANAMQKILGVGAIIVIPVMSEEKVIGVIEVGTKRKRTEVTASEIATLESIADELGVVARNIKLFEQIRQANAQLEVANQHLQELDRAKSEFVSIASHQLRTPMTGIMGYLSMMTQGDFGKIKDEHQKILVDLLAESQRMIRLINQFLNVSKIEAGKFTYTKAPVQLASLVEHEIIEVTKTASDKGLKLVNKMPKQPLPAITVDADKLQDVILNLIDNAIKYTDKGSITISAEQEGGNVHFRVKDTGIGIKPADASALFSKFVRGSGIAQIHPDGSGLGLFIAKSIIDAHGGRIWAESDGEGKGSTFQFVIPITPPADGAGLTPPSAAAVIGKPRAS